MIALFVVQVGFGEQVGHAEHAIERRADFVTHGRKECFLCARRLHHPHIGFDQFDFRLFAIGDVRNRSYKTHRPLIGIALRYGAGAHPKVIAVLAAHPRFKIE